MRILGWVFYNWLEIKYWLGNIKTLSQIFQSLVLRFLFRGAIKEMRRGKFSPGEKCLAGAGGADIGV